jgi:hypothetical protein
VDASFDPRAEPSTTRAAWEKVRDDLEQGMHLGIINCGPGPTAFAEANAKQAFVDILDTSVITPLATFKVNETDLVWVSISLIIDVPEGNKR